MTIFDDMKAERMLSIGADSARLAEIFWTLLHGICSSNLTSPGFLTTRSEELVTTMTDTFLADEISQRFSFREVTPTLRYLKGEQVNSPNSTTSSSFFGTSISKRHSPPSYSIKAEYFPTVKFSK